MTDRELASRLLDAFELVEITSGADLINAFRPIVGSAAVDSAAMCQALYAERKARGWPDRNTAELPALEVEEVIIDTLDFIRRMQPTFQGLKMRTLRPEHFDGSGVRLPQLGDDQDEDSLYPAEVVEEMGAQVRAEFTEQQLRRVKETYGAPYSTSVPPDPANDRVVRETVVEPPKIPEPKRLRNKPAPTWSARRGTWLPAAWYGKDSYHYAHLYKEKKTAAEPEETDDAPLPTLRVV
jgi:hypothetical protein